MFSILRPERAKKLSIGVHGFAENRENRQPLDTERDRKWTRKRNQKKITNSENDSLLVESYLRGNNTSGSPARNYDPSSFIGSAEKLDHVRAQVGSGKSLLEALHDR